MVLCSICKAEMKRVKKNKDLPCIPHEWYVNKMDFDKVLVFYCADCKVFRVLSYFEQIKYKLIKKLGGEM